MFDSQKYILYFQSQTIRVASGTEVKEEVPWTDETLSAALIGIKKKFGDTYSIMVDDDLTFAFGISIPADTKDEREFIRIKASETVPEEIDDFGWDYKEVLEDAGRKNKIVQFVSLDNRFCRSLSKAVADSGIKVTATEPMVCSLARLLAGDSEPILAIHGNGKKYLAFISLKGLVLSTESFDAEPAPARIVKFLEFVKEEFDVAPKEVFLSGDFKSLNAAVPEFTGWKVQKKDLDPLSGMVMKQDIGGEDRADLNIPLDFAKIPARPESNIIGISETGKEPGMEQYEPIGLDIKDHQKRKEEKFINFVILAASLAVLLVNGFILYQNNQAEQIINGAAKVAPHAGQ
ncbi:MAG: hypothetical protein P4M11_02015 [Candidatus Pacebacteria bacterium]|nr:hypothetical protein [Candidatus Paceibacterota bacterium]